MALKIEVGKKYEDSRGEEIEILDKWLGVRWRYPFIGNYDCDYNEEGKASNGDADCDLIQEVKE